MAWIRRVFSFIVVLFSYLSHSCTEFSSSDSSFVNFLLINTWFIRCSLHLGFSLIFHLMSQEESDTGMCKSHKLFLGCSCDDTWRKQFQQVKLMWHRSAGSIFYQSRTEKLCHQPLCTLISRFSEELKECVHWLVEMEDTRSRKVIHSTKSLTQPPPHHLSSWLK